MGLVFPCEPKDGSICGAISVSVCQSIYKGCGAPATEHVREEVEHWKVNQVKLIESLDWDTCKEAENEGALF